MNTVNVLGTQYSISESNTTLDSYLNGRDGYCDTSIKKIVVDEMLPTHQIGEKKNLKEYKKSVKRHEIIHAFLFESGLDSCSWGSNEEMVDWIALQGMKLYQAWREVGAI